MFRFPCLRDGCLLRADTDDVLCTERYEKSQGTDQFCHAFYHGDFFPLCHRTCCIGRADLSSAFPGNGTDGTYGRYHDVGWGNGGCVYAMSTLSNGLLQGIDRLKIPVINAAVSLVAHVIVLIILMLFFRMNIYAVIIANMFFAFLMCIMNALAIRKYSGYHQEIHKTFIVPGISSAIMGIITYIVYHGSYAVLKINAVSAMLAILAAVIVYAVVLLLLHGLTEEEIKNSRKELCCPGLQKNYLLK